MQQSWSSLVEPLLRAVRPRTILEIGIGDGGNTRHLAGFARSTGARVHSVDPFPYVDVHALVAEFSPHLTFHVARSLDVVDLIGPTDVALVDGDHNWSTVHRELHALARINRSCDRRPPLTILHDVGWPYGRRDAYMDPELPQSERHPATTGGLYRSGGKPLPRSGLSWPVEHADHEGGPRNGVRTAVEDFVGEIDEPMRFADDPYNWGVGVLVPHALLDHHRGVQDVMDRLDDPAFRAERTEAERSRLDSFLSFSPPVAAHA